MIIDELNFRQKLSWFVHAWKAVMYQHHREMLEPFSRFIKSDSIVVDVGAHSGQYTKLLAKLAKDGKVISYEPGSYARSILTRVVKLRGLRNVEIRPYALGSKQSEFHLNVPVKKSGSLGFGRSFVGNPDNLHEKVLSETIHILPLDQSLRGGRSALPKVDFIKADIEGHELEMLKGAEKILKESRPVLFIEVSDKSLKRAGADSTALFDFLKSMDYFPADLHTGALKKWDDMAGGVTEHDFLFKAAA